MTADPTPAAAGRTVAVASGKGGVGKTWFSITLAHALARRGRRVLLFDGDLGLANVDIQLGLTPARDLGAVIAGQATLAAGRHPARGWRVRPRGRPLRLRRVRDDGPGHARRHPRRAARAGAAATTPSCSISGPGSTARCGSSRPLPTRCS